MGLIAAVEPEAATNIAHGMNAYLNGLPEPLYALFGTGYLGDTVARQWGISRGLENSCLTPATSVTSLYTREGL